MVHCSPDSEASRSRRIDGSATFTMVLSIDTMSRLLQQMSSTRTLRRAVMGTPSVSCRNQRYEVSATTGVTCPGAGLVQAAGLGGAAAGADAGAPAAAPPAGGVGRGG